MAVTAQSIIRRAAEVINDTTGVRWATNELVRWLNDGQREVVTYRPDAMVTSATLSLAAGAKQSLPAGGVKLMDVIRNTNGNKRAVRQTNRDMLDATIPNWQGMTGVAEVLHFMFDPRDPKTFYVYPPAGTGGTAASLEILYTAMPTDVAEPADGTTYTSVSGNISVPDIYANALLDYVLYRAYSKDSEFAGNVQRAAAHYAAFANVLGIEIKATVAVAPTQPFVSNSRPMTAPQA